MKINSTMKIRVKHIAMILTLLLIGSMVNEAWAYKVTYHILTLPMSSSTYNIKSEYGGKRMEAIRVIVNNATTVELPDHFKSPLATDFKYYEASQVTKSAAAESLYDNGSNKGYLYELVATPVEIASTDVTSNREIYVTYSYNESNTIAKLDGSVDYNIVISGGFLSLNRGRNNRPAVFPTAKVSASDLISDDFVKVAVNGTNISAYWNDVNLNKNKRADVESNFHFLFKFIGGDPYNIIVSTAYSKNTTYIEAYNNEPQLYKWYKDAHLLAKSTDNAFLASDDHILYATNWDSNLATNPTDITYTDKKGYFHSLSAPVWNTVALLNNTTNTGFVFMGTRCADTNGNMRDPNDNKYYYLQNANNNNLKFGLTTAADASNKYSTEEKKVYPIKTVNFMVTTSFYSIEATDAHIVTATTRLSEYTIDHDPIDEKFIPGELKRKYCTFTKFYKDAAHTQEITKFTDAYNDGTKQYDVYVDYEVSASAPFKGIDPASAYSAATWTAASWYELTDKDETANKKIKYEAPNFKNNGVTATYEKVSEYGFIGDPYELRVILRSATAGTTPHYVGAAGTPETGTQLTTTTPESDAAGYKWEIPYDATDGMLLRLYKGTGHWYWDTTGSSQNVAYSTASSTRVKVLELPKFTYTYNIVDNAGRIAIKATAVQTVFTPISGYASIPEDIRSPFLADEAITYYEDDYVDGSGRANLTRSITETPGTADDIFVSYTTTQLSSKSIKLDNETFNVKLNDEYIYWDGANIVSNADPTSGELASNAYLWRLPGGDPYAMKIYNMGNAKFVKKDGDSWANDKALLFDATAANASLFIAMMGNYAGVYEVLAATGTTDLYHIGRASTTGAETKIYSIDTKNGGYAHGADQLRFELAGQTLITYTLVDKAKTELLTVTSNNPRLALPSEYQSPLVATYYYYKTKDDAITDDKSKSITEIAKDDGDNRVWVTYTVNDLVSFNTTSSTRNNPYLLRFHDGESYYMEDGADKLTTGDKIQAMYPYCNGDGNLNIYGERMRNEQMNGGTSTRSRWQWFFESANSDPYHVKIHSYNKITMPGGGQDFTYLHTSAEHFDQEPADKPNKKRIVTGTTLPGSGVPATEYMILGTAGHYKLLTTDPVAADLDGDGNTTGSGENERQYVTSFEQYWKTYNMVKQYLLELGEDTDEPSTNPSTFVMPSEKWSDLKDALTAKGIKDTTDPNYLDGSNWHSYSNVASAIRWNGYNNDGTHKSRVVEELEHWFQTFDMGDGTFDIEDGFIPPVLVLLDRHGWEIMRKPIPTPGDTDTEADSKLAELRAFDSPMVKRYTFYSNAQKVSNCHKFEIRMQDGKERDTIEVNNVRFTSTSLAELPPYAENRDLFVTYTVKEEYGESYTYSLNYSESKDGSGKTVYTINSETGTPSAFIVLQNHQFATENGSSITPSSAPDNLSDEIIADAEKPEVSKTFQLKSLWYLQPNLEIDDEMGIPWPWSTATNGENSHTKPETKVDYYKNKRTGFDPYNLQLKNVSTGKFFTIHMTQSRLDGGAYTGVYSGDGGSLNVTLADACTTPISSPESYDHSTLKMTNQTFMAVQDENGNMQLMPRFDHSHRINAFTTLAEPLTHDKAEVDDPSPGEQTTFFVRPLVFDYQVIDNQGRVALRYKMGGEYYPSMPDHFKSPLAKDFKFYKTAPVYNSGTKTLTVTDEITSSFAAAGVKESASIYIRYSYNDTYDTANQNILQGQWLTMSLGGKDVQATGTLSTADGTGISLYTGTKDATQPEWQWKFLQSPMASTSDLYVAPDPYCVIISNREANNDIPTNTPSKMATAIKVSDKDRFVILTHPEGDYALLAAGNDLSSYSFLNGGSMTTNVAEPKTAASVEPEEFSKASNSISDDARIIFNEDVTHIYTYYIINNSKKLAASETQDDATAAGNEFKPVVPYNIQSPIVNDEDYLYYGTAKISGDTYTIDSDVEKFIIDNLYGLFDDKVYVRYPAFSRDNTPYMVPNERNNSSPVAVGAGSNDVAIDINGNLPYNIIWHSDNMMSLSDGTTIINGGDKGHQLSATNADMWHFEGSDPYAINIYNMHESVKKYITRTCSTCGGTGKVEEVDCNDCSGKGWVSTCRLAASPTSFMLLKRDDYDYGVLAVTGEQTTMLSGYGQTIVTGGTAPTKFIPFALSVHHLIYHLVIATSCANHASPGDGQYVDIPYRKGTEDSWKSDGWTTYDQADPKTKRIFGTTQRDLSTTYQLGETVNGQNYSKDVGKVSIGDKLEVPAVFYRPNCSYLYYVEGVYDDVACSEANSDLNNKYKGLEITKLMSDADLIGKTVRVNIAYGFATGLETNAGEGFVTDKNDNLWYTFETNDATPYLAHYTNAWGLQSMEGRATRYTNDYLWKPLGDPYGFVMYNRYMMKNSSSDAVMTTTSFDENVKVKMAVKDANAVYELLAEESTTPGYFLVHPVVNKDGAQYYMKRNESSGDIDGDGHDDKDYAILSTTPTEWKFGLSPELIQPYLERVGYVGGLKKTAYDAMADDLVTAIQDGSATAAQLMTAQGIVYNDANIVGFTSGYYRLHNQPGVSNISPVRYASGYLHDIEKTAVSGGIPMHFYSRVNTNTTFAGDGGLGSGFTESDATRGDIPVLATEYDPSSIFYISGTSTSATMSTQGLYVAQNAMGDANNGTGESKLQRAAMSGTLGDAIHFNLMDIGGAVFLIHDGATPDIRNYLNFDQSNASDIYDLKYYHNAPTDDAKWCLQPVQKSATAGTNEMGLRVRTNNGGDDHYYATFCAPFDVLLTDAEKDVAYIVPSDGWPTIEAPSTAGVAKSKKIGLYNTEDNGCPERYRENNLFIPAGTPAIIRTTSTEGYVTLALPTTTPSTSVTTALSGTALTGKYLEQILPTLITATDKVYAFGLPITGYNLTIDPADGFTNGEVNNVLEGSAPATTGVGFYLNANRNKEKSATSGQWTPNNRYVLHNKIYYRAGGSGAMTRGVEFIPVIFDDDAEDNEFSTGVSGIKEDANEEAGRSYDNRVYDLQGRCVATEEQVKDGTWKNNLTPGVYIMSGKKIIVK